MSNEHRTAECPTGCGQSVTYEVVTYQNQEYPGGPPMCSRCATEAQERERSREREAEEAERRDREENILELLHRAGCNPWEHGRADLAGFTDPANRAAADAARAFVIRTRKAAHFAPVPGLYLEGPTGTGKTHLLVAIARELLLAPKFPRNGVVFDHAAALITEIQDAYSSSDISVRETKRRRIEAPVWLLDDLGTERPSDDVARILTEILTLRALRPTAITSNHAPDELEARHPELWRLGSRLGPAYFHRATVLGPDRRHTQETGGLDA